jgi:predicted dithiol-disulfide oxidoreductase (DUF899 family)
MTLPNPVAFVTHTCRRRVLFSPHIEEAFMQSTNPTVVSRAEWLAARKRLLAKEKEFTRERDRLSAERRALPWERVDKDYVFERAAGKASLGDLFDGKSQLIVYHFMFDPEWDVGCKSCSFWADNFDRIVVHVRERDANLIAVSRAPLAKLGAFAKRLGWTFEWVSSAASDFNYDYGVSFSDDQVKAGEVSYNYGAHKAFGREMPGVSVFFRDGDGAIFHTYSCYSRGLDTLNTAYHYLDLLPKGRDEDGLDYPMAWLRLRDDYGHDVR